MPKLPPRPCSAPRCGKYATKRGRCDEHQPTHNWDHKGQNRHDRGYGSDWDDLRETVMRAHGYLCQCCKRAGRYTRAAQVDHIVPKSQGGTNDMDNLEPICDDCHKAKTQREARYGRLRNNSRLDEP